MTSAALLQRAAELVLAFGLDDADTTEQQVRASAERGDALIVSWRLACAVSRVELVVVRRTASLSARINVSAVGLCPDDAKRVHLLYARVIDLASRIEALR